MNANAPRLNPDAIDHTIDRALSALRDAQPRSGLEGRILAHLEHRTATPQPRGLHLSAHLALWTATSAAILAVTSMMVLHHRIVRSKNAVSLSEASQPHGTTSDAVILSDPERVQRVEGESKNPDSAHRATNPQPFSTTNLAQTTNTPSSRPAKSAVILSEAPQGRSRRTPVFENARSTEPPSTAATTPTDAQLLADLHAPSHPAPPLPLTPDEKLFLHALRYGNLTEIAELNPLLRAKQAADETAAFKAFFPDPPPVQQPNGDTE